MVRDHQSGEAVFRSILLEDIEWKPFPAFSAVRPSERSAVGSIFHKIPFSEFLGFGHTEVIE